MEKDKIYSNVQIYVFAATIVINFIVVIILKSHFIFSLYYKVVVYSPYPRGVCYTVKDAVDWLNSPTARRFRIGSNHSPLQYC